MAAPPLPSLVWFLGFDSMMEFIAFVIAVAVAYQALKGYKLSKERTFLYLHFSFVLLGTGLLVDGLASLVVLIARFHRGLLFLYAFGYTINFIAQAIAYGLLVYAYLRQTRSTSTQLAATALISALFFERNTFAEAVLIVLLLYITIQTAMNYSLSKTRSSLLVFGAFASLALAHLFFLLFVLFPFFFPLAHIAQLFGFLLLLAMLLRVNQPS